MSDKIYTQHDMDVALENAEFNENSDLASQNGVSPLRDGNLTDCALFILAKRGVIKPCLGEIIAVEAKLQEAGL